MSYLWKGKLRPIFKLVSGRPSKTAGAPFSYRESYPSQGTLFDWLFLLKGETTANFKIGGFPRFQTAASRCLMKYKLLSWTTGDRNAAMLIYFEVRLVFESVRHICSYLHSDIASIFVPTDSLVLLKGETTANFKIGGFPRFQTAASRF